MEQTETNIYSEEFKAVLKGLVESGEFKRDILFNGTSSSCKALNDTQKEELSKRFKAFVNENIISCNNDEVGFILNCEETITPYGIGKPYDWEDVTNNQSVDTERLMIDLIDNIEEKDFSKVNDTYNRHIKTIGDFEVFLNSLDSVELEEYTENETDLCYFEYEEDNEVYQWFKVTGWLCEKLNSEGEQTIQSHNYWGRGSFGQSVELDHCIQQVFLNMWLSV